MTQDKCKYGVFTKNREFAIKTINSFIDQESINKIISRKDCYEVFMEYGDTYMWIRPNDNSRGHKMNVCIVDLATCNMDYIHEWIPCICYKPTDNPYLFVDSEINEDNQTYYDLHTLIDRLKKIEMLYGNIKKIGFYDRNNFWDMNFWDMINYLYVDVKKDIVSLENHCEDNI